MSKFIQSQKTILTFDQSTKVITNFIKTFISEILFQRKCLDYNAFKKVNVSGMELHMMKNYEDEEENETFEKDSNFKHPNSFQKQNLNYNKMNLPKIDENTNRKENAYFYQQLKKYLLGIDDAIQKKYLR